MKEFEIKGFKNLYVRNVPIGHVLNRATESLYDIVWSGSWISDDKELIIQSESNLDEYTLICKNMNYSYSTGSIDFILKKVNEYYKNKKK